MLVTASREYDFVYARRLLTVMLLMSTRSVFLFCSFAVFTFYYTRLITDTMKAQMLELKIKYYYNITHTYIAAYIQQTEHK